MRSLAKELEVKEPADAVTSKLFDALAMGYSGLHLGVLTEYLISQRKLVARLEKRIKVLEARK